MNERDPYRFDKIPDFAMQPARDDIDDFDPSVYEKLLAGLTPAESGKEQEEKPEAAISVSAPASPAVSAETESLEPTVPEVIAVPAPKTEDTAASIPEQAAGIKREGVCKRAEIRKRSIRSRGRGSCGKTDRSGRAGGARTFCTSIAGTARRER